MSAVENKKPFEFDRNSQKKLQLYSETVYFDANGQPKPSGTNGGQVPNQQLSTTQNQSSHVLSASYHNGIQGQPVTDPITQIHHHQPVQQCSPINSGFVQQHHMVHSQSAYIQQQPAGLQQYLLMNPQTSYIQYSQPPMQQTPQVYREAVPQPMQKNVLNSHNPQPMPQSRVMNTNERSHYPPPLMQLNTNFQHHNRQHCHTSYVHNAQQYQNESNHYIQNGHASYNVPPNAYSQIWRAKQMASQSNNGYCNNGPYEQNCYTPGTSHAMVSNQSYNPYRRAEYPHSEQSNWRKYPNSSSSRQPLMKYVVTKQTESTIVPPQSYAPPTKPAVETAPPNQPHAEERNREAENENFNQSTVAEKETQKAVDTVERTVGITSTNETSMRNESNTAPPTIQTEFNPTSVDMTPSPSISPVSEDDGHNDHFPSLQQAQREPKQQKPLSKTLTYSEKVKQSRSSDILKMDVKRNISHAVSAKTASTSMPSAVTNKATAGPIKSENDQKAVSTGLGVRDKTSSLTSHTSPSDKPRKTSNVKFVPSGSEYQKDLTMKKNRYSHVEPSMNSEKPQCSSFYKRPNRRYSGGRNATNRLDSIVEEKSTEQKGCSDCVTARNPVIQIGKKHATPTIFINGKKATSEQLNGNQKRSKAKYRKKSARERRMDKQQNAQNEKETADLQVINEDEEPSYLNVESNLEEEKVPSVETEDVSDATIKLPVLVTFDVTSEDTNNTETDENKNSDSPKSNTSDILESAESTSIESHDQLNETSTKQSILPEQLLSHNKTLNDSTQPIDFEVLTKTTNAENNNKEKPAPRKSKSQKKKERKKQKKLTASENTEFNEFLQKENAGGPEESKPTTSEPSNPPISRKQEKKKRLEEIKRKETSLKFIQRVLPDYLAVGTESLDLDCKKMGEKLVYYCHGLYQTRRCPLALGLRDAETNSFFFEPPTGFGKEVLDYLSFRPLLHWNRIENLDDCEDFLKEKIDLYKNGKDATQKQLHLLYRTMSQFNYSFFYEDIFYIMSQNYNEEQAKLKDIEYLEFIEKLSAQQINDAVKKDWPTPEELQKHVTTKIESKYCGYFINYLMRQYSCRIFYNLEPTEVYLQEDGMLNLCKTITEVAIGWSPYNTEEFYHEMLEGLKDMQQTPKVQLYETFWKFMLEITSFICDEDVYVMQERLDCNPENIVHHDYLFKLWFGYGLLDKFEK
ncbi:unnamed protein product [Caenorhabditis brenneri]